MHGIGSGLCGSGSSGCARTKSSGQRPQCAAWAAARVGAVAAAVRDRAVSVCDEALMARPVRRKNSRKRNGAPRPKALKEFAAARVGGPYCIVARYEFFAEKFGWTGSKRSLCPWAYGAYLGRYRVALQVACGLSEKAAARFGTHSGRRGAAHEARAGGADPRALRSFAGVTSTLWETWYADGLVPAERIEISRQLVTAVAE